MSAQLNSVPAEYSNAVIVDNYDLAFDPGDKLNGSLYFCTLRGTTANHAENWIAPLRAGALWSDTPHKTVPDEQRQAYKDGLIFVAAIAYRAGHRDRCATRPGSDARAPVAARWRDRGPDNRALATVRQGIRRLPTTR